MAGEFLDFAELNDSLTATSKKLEKRALIATYLQALGLEDAARAALYLAGTPFAETDRLKLNVGGSLLTKALMQRAGLENEAGQAALHAAYRRHGDLGAAAEDLLSNAASVAPSLTLKMVEDLLAKVAAARGPGAKLPLVVALLDEAVPVEAKYLLKLMLDDMRTGVKQSLVEEAIAAAFEADAGEVRRASMLAGSLPAVVRLAAQRRLGEARMKLFHPLGFMLASPVDSVEEAVERFTEEVLLEVIAPEASVPDAGGPGEDVSGSHSHISRARCGAPGLQKKPASGSKRIPQRLKPHTSSTSYVRAEARTLQDPIVPDPIIPGTRAKAHFHHPIVPDPIIPGTRAEAHFHHPIVPDPIIPDTRAEAHFHHPIVPDPIIPDTGDEAHFPADERARLAPCPDTNPAVSAASEDRALSGTRIHGVLEDKYDGIRAQIHCGDGSEPGRVEIFSRSRDDLSASFPELVEAFAAIPEKAILDGEILAWNAETGRALPFSVLQQRLGRKRVTQEMRELTPVVFMAFDVMFLGDALLLEEPLLERRRRLVEFVEHYGGLTANAVARGQASLFPGEAAEFARLMLAPAVALESAEQLDAAYSEARARGNEGVMLKSLNSKYQPGRRGLAWLKLKRELATLDVVVTGAEFGHGRRAGVLSDYTFAVRDGDTLKNVGKAYSGLTDAEIDELTAYFKEHTLEDFGYFRTVEPLKVLEVAFNNVMRSDRHDSGFALRFPRILRIRDDKPVGEIDTLARVGEIYESQPDKPSGGEAGS